MSDENIDNENFYRFICKHSHLINIKLTNFKLKSSWYFASVFENCVFMNCNFNQCKFVKIFFDTCKFKTIENENYISALAYTELISCHFHKTLLTGFAPEYLVVTVLINSKFSTDSKSIEFKGDFYLFDILLADEGINSIFTRFGTQTDI